MGRKVNLEDAFWKKETNEQMIYAFWSTEGFIITWREKSDE